MTKVADSDQKPPEHPGRRCPIGWDSREACAPSTASCSSVVARRSSPDQTRIARDSMGLQADAKIAGSARSAPKMASSARDRPRLEWFPASITLKE